MRLFSKRKNPLTPEVQTCATADRGIVPPLHYSDHPAEYRLYRELREKVPVIDAAIFKLVRLTGGFTVDCADPGAAEALRAFLAQVPVGGNRQGVAAFLSTYFEQLLTCGTALGEIVTGEERVILC